MMLGIGEVWYFRGKEDVYSANSDWFTNMRVAWFIIEQTSFQKRVCESLDECYLYFLNNHLISLNLLYSHYYSIILIYTLYS